MDNGNLVGRFPAIIKSYDKQRRKCRVDIPALHSGTDTYPEADIEYPIGDKSKSGNHSTEIELLEGDTVWVDFICGDPRYPVITGYRNPTAGNGADYRRFHHKNIQLLADEKLQLDAKNLIAKIVENINITADGDITITLKGKLKINADGEVNISSSQLKINGSVAIVGSNVTHNSKNIGAMHTHSGVQSGMAITGVPN